MKESFMRRNKVFTFIIIIRFFMFTFVKMRIIKERFDICKKICLRPSIVFNYFEGFFFSRNNLQVQWW